MPSLNFENEKHTFRSYYDENRNLLEIAKASFITLISSLTRAPEEVPISKIEGRVKEREECIKKFNLKYRTSLEGTNTPYSIADHITDLIGLRVVCLYEDDIEKIKNSLCGHLTVVDITDKISQVENTESSFGYKGLHLDLKLDETRGGLPEHSEYKHFLFEVQIRTIIQDSWSVLDHKIKYKKSIPNGLKRRINSLAALFEVADREFREIRDATLAGIQEEDVSEEQIIRESDETHSRNDQPRFQYARLNAFSFLKIASHFFRDFEFEPHKTDGFTQEILELKSDISRGKFNFYMREAISKIKEYKSYFENENPLDKLNPYTMIRHCLYFGDRDVFSSMLTNAARESFDSWLSKAAANS